MAERPIIFSGPMVRAILEGKKTQTRRIARVDRSRGIHRCIYGRPGDLLWVRETWAPHDGIENEPNSKEGFTYRADWALDDDRERDHKWRPAIFMPRSASRISLVIITVRNQRLQDISDFDLTEEGFTDLTAFQVAWSAINGKRAPWDSNPWIWAIEFSRVEEPNVYS